MRATVSVPLGWDAGIEIPERFARRSPSVAFEQHIDFRFVRPVSPVLAPSIEHARYDRRGQRIRSDIGRGRLLDEYS